MCRNVGGEPGAELTAPYFEMWRTKSAASLKSGSGTMVLVGGLVRFVGGFARLEYHGKRRLEGPEKCWS